MMIKINAQELFLAIIVSFYPKEMTVMASCLCIFS